IVVTDLPAISDTWVWQENARLPSMCTMQAPHRPVPQPNLVPVSLSPSRITHNKGVAGGASVAAGLPFTVKLTAMISSLQADRLRSTDASSIRVRRPLSSLRCGSSQSPLHARGLEGQVADSFPGRVGKGIGDGSNRRSL